MCFASFILACAPRKANSTRSRVTSPHVRQYTEKCRSLVVRSTFSKALNFRNHIALLDATLKVKKLDGEEPSVRHKASLTQEDLSRLEAYFSDVLQANDPIKLTEFVWYVITLHFGLRAREIQVQLRKSDLEFRSDDSGDYFVLNKDFASKNPECAAVNKLSPKKWAILLHTIALLFFEKRSILPSTEGNTREYCPTVIVCDQMGLDSKDFIISGVNWDNPK